MVCIVINGEALPYSETLIEKLKRIPKMTGILLNKNTNRTNVILGSETKTLWGQEYITDYLGDLEFKISPLSFFQVNPIQTEILYNKVLEFAQLESEDIVIDAYCGIGTISLFLAKHAGEVYGVEVVPQAIQDAISNAQLNNISNVHFILGKSEIVIPKMLRDSAIKPKLIVVDPPRKGCERELIDAVANAKPDKIIYVSCDPATLARDLQLFLQDEKYNIEKIQPIDCFPMTYHVETVVQLSLKKDVQKMEITMEPDTVSNYTTEEKATYPKIKDYVKDKYGVNVHTSYIAEVKRMCGLDMGENYNKSKKDNSIVNHCPQEKVEYIKDALRYFGAINQEEEH